MKALLGIIVGILLTGVVNAQRQGIKGKVEWLSGNQMPGPDRIASAPQGIKREICIYEAVFMQDTQSDGVFFSGIQSRLVKKVRSKANGTFKVKLPVGDYSIFIKEKKGLFANRFDGQNRINSVTVKPGEFTEISILVDYEAAY